MKPVDNEKIDGVFKTLSAGKSGRTASGANPSGTERRQHERVVARFPVALRTAKGREFPANVLDLSAFGLCLECDQEALNDYLREGDVVSVALNSPYLAAASVRTLEDFEVLSCTPVAGNIWCLRLKSVRSASGSDASLAPIKPSELVIPPALKDLFMKLQAQINIALPEASSRVLVVTGAQENAGASTIAWWLATCLARTPGRKVLFVDGKLQSPELGDDAVTDGFVDVLQGTASLEDAVVALGPGAPDVLGVGHCERFASTNVGRGEVASTFNAMRDQFDYVVVDAPPAGTSPVGLLWAEAANGCFLVIESEKTQRDIARTATDRLRACGANVLGVVLNKF
jgi:Mrp family chromosome partitioning ATPase